MGRAFVICTTSQKLCLFEKYFFNCVSLENFLPHYAIVETNSIIFLVR